MLINVVTSNVTTRWTVSVFNPKEKGMTMIRYMTLLRFTSQGAKGIKKSPSRAAAFRKACAKTGVEVETLLWTTGEYDGVLILSANDERKALSMIARLASQGNVQTQTLRAFDAKEFAAIVR